MSTKYVYLGERRIVTKDSTDKLEFVHDDHISSSNIITDENGDQTGMLEYTPYGTTASHTGTSDPKHKFTGQEEDDSTGLYYYGARYYDAQLGRFITADPTIQHPTDPQDFNRYAYARNNPIVFTDPTGFGFWKSFFKALAVVAVVVVVVIAVYLVVAFAALAIMNAGASLAIGAGVGVEAGAAVAGGISTAAVAQGVSVGTALVAGGVAGTVTAVGMNSSSVNATQMGQNLAPQSQTMAIHAPEEADWINRLKDATARGPHPDLFKSDGPSQLPPAMNMGGAVVIAGGFQSLLPSPGIQLGIEINHVTKSPRSKPKKPQGNKKPKPNKGKGPKQVSDEQQKKQRPQNALPEHNSTPEIETMTKEDKINKGIMDAIASFLPS